MSRRRGLLASDPLCEFAPVDLPTGNSRVIAFVPHDRVTQLLPAGVGGGSQGLPGLPEGVEVEGVGWCYKRLKLVSVTKQTFSPSFARWLIVMQKYK